RARAGDGELAPLRVVGRVLLDHEAADEVFVPDTQGHRIAGLDEDRLSALVGSSRVDELERGGGQRCTEDLPDLAALESLVALAVDDERDGLRHGPPPARCRPG